MLCKDDQEFLINTWDTYYKVAHIYRLKVDKLKFVGLHISAPWEKDKKQSYVFKRMIVFGPNKDKLIATTTEGIRMYLIEENNFTLLRETKIDGYTQCNYIP